MTLAPYLGPAGGLVKLPVPQGSSVPSVDAPRDRGGQVAGLIGGGSSRVSWLRARGSWTLPYEYLSPDAGDLLTGLYEGLYGRGPYLFVDPNVRNVLPLDTASCGARSEAWHGWLASVGTLARTGTPPKEAAASGVLTWTSLAAAATLEPGTASAAPDLTTAAPWLPGEPCTASLWVKASAAATATLQLAGYDAAGTLVTSALSTPLTLSTAWLVASVTSSPYEAVLAAAGAVYVAPRLLLASTVPTSVSVAAAQIEYADARSEWQRGYGSSRVHIASTPGRTTPLTGWVNHTLSLREA